MLLAWRTRIKNVFLRFLHFSIIQKKKSIQILSFEIHPNSKNNFENIFRKLLTQRTRIKKPFLKNLVWFKKYLRMKKKFCSRIYKTYNNLLYGARLLITPQVKVTQVYVGGSWRPLFLVHETIRKFLIEPLLNNISSVRSSTILLKVVVYTVWTLYMRMPKNFFEHLQIVVLVNRLFEEV